MPPRRPRTYNFDSMSDILDALTELKTLRRVGGSADDAAAATRLAEDMLANSGKISDVIKGLDNKGGIATAMRNLDDDSLENVMDVLDADTIKSLSATNGALGAKFNKIAVENGKWDKFDKLAYANQSGRTFIKNASGGPGKLMDFCKKERVICAAPFMLGGMKWITDKLGETVSSEQSVACTASCLPTNWDEHIYGSLAKTDLVYNTLEDAKESDPDFDGKADEFCTANINDCGEFCKTRCLERYGQSRAESAARDAGQAARDAADGVLDFGIDSLNKIWKETIGQFGKVFEYAVLAVIVFVIIFMVLKLARVI